MIAIISLCFINIENFTNMSKESGAISLLTRAVELDGKKQWTSALVCYKEGLQMLMEAIGTESMDPAKKSRFKEKAKEYMNRAEILKKNIEAAKVGSLQDF